MPYGPQSYGPTGVGQAATELLGSTLPEQLEQETEEQRRRRLLMEQMQAAVSPFGVSGTLGLPGAGFGERQRSFGRR